MLLNIFRGQYSIYQERRHLLQMHLLDSHCFVLYYVKANLYQGSESWFSLLMATYFLRGHQDFLFVLRSSVLEQLDIDYDV